MRTASHWTVRLLSCALVVALCGISEVVQAQSLPQTPKHGISAEEPPLEDQRTPRDPASVEENAAPQPAALPNAPSFSQAPPMIAQAQDNPAPAANAPAAQDQNTPNTQTAASPTAAANQNAQTPPAQNKPAEEPVGAAAAQAGATSGGAASKPAGMAIAPAKQRQVRSWLIKLGALAAGGAAIGAVVALSQGSPSKPPGAK